MSVQADGKLIACDVPGCSATAPLPVALRSTLHDKSANLDSLAGWVFELSDGISRHYCPVCGHSLLWQSDRHPLRPRQKTTDILARARS